MRFQIGAMSVGDILDRSIKLLLARFPTLFTINLIVQLPGLLYGIAMPALIEGAPPDQFIGRTGPSLLLLILLFVVLPPIGTGATLMIISQEFIDRRIGVGEALRTGLARFGSLFVGSLIFGLMWFLGCCCFCAPGALFFSWFVLFSPIIVVEKFGPIRCFDRSRELSEGYRLRILGIFLALFILYVILVLALSVVLNYLFPPDSFVQTQIGPLPHYNARTQAYRQLLTFPLNIVATTFWSICLTLLYFDIRIRKEGFDLDLAARQQAPELS